MIVVVTGGRGFGDPKRVWTKLSGVNKETQIKALLQGGAQGADAYAKGWGEHPQRKSNGLVSITYNADWRGWTAKGRMKVAGHARNMEMMILAKEIQAHFLCDVMCLAFPGGRGTENAKTAAGELDIMVVEG